ncbi:hypothetical protein [Lachnotalea sp. AF33-28]|uniref:hypothetical protein n=1 Tax=Lachnotalea sp. AF33-28 TaxID=2292046 RepID=UPI000E5334B8|nr:hypothetical protein [Lachnotalea sp. AF33-28]RHP33896.1 hypothetical protein DWZ56_08465 [Lachnotalea sp. AF33-28]
MEHQENRKLNCKNIWIPLLFAVLFLALVLISSCQLYQSGLLRDELGYRYEAVFYNGIGLWLSFFVSVLMLILSLVKLIGCFTAHVPIRPFYLVISVLAVIFCLIIDVLCMHYHMLL